MATATQIGRLREFIAEPDNVDPYTDTKLSAIIDAEGTPEAAAYRLWMNKAASASSLVDMSEGGSTRKLSSLQTNAFSMADRFKAWANDPTAVVVSTGPTVGTIVRD